MRSTNRITYLIVCVLGVLKANDTDIIRASKFLETFSVETSDWSPNVVDVGVVLSLTARVSLVAGCNAADVRPDAAAAGLSVDLSTGVWLLLIEFCRLSVMPRGGPPTSRL